MGEEELLGESDIEEYRETSINDILMFLYEEDQSLALKTHIVNPKGLARLKALGDFLTVERYTSAGLFIDNFITIYLKYMISKDRLGRIEAIKGISHVREDEARPNISIGERLTTNLKKGE